MKEQESNPSSVERLQSFQQMLREAIDYGYDTELLSFGSLPIDVLLDAAVDIFLLIGKFLTEGRSSSKKNQGIRFSDKHQDVLGNPKQMKINYPSTYYWDPKAEEVFLQLARALIKVKNHKNIRKTFMVFSENCDLSSTSRKTRSKNKNLSQYHWWRRQRRRFRLRDRKSTL